VYDWAAGLNFIDICTSTDAPEGAIVKTIMRLDILFRNLKSGCFIIGNTTLAEKIDAASELIKRDIVFAQSLYIN
jgi:antiviral helicase SKI2